MGGRTYYCFHPTDGQFQLFADCPDKVHAVNIYGMFLTVEEATAQIEAITWDQPDPDLEQDEDGDGIPDDEGEGEGEDGADDGYSDEGDYYVEDYYYDESVYY